MAAVDHFRCGGWASTLVDEDDKVSDPTWEDVVKGSGLAGASCGAEAVDDENDDDDNDEEITERKFGLIHELLPLLVREPKLVGMLTGLKGLGLTKA